MLTSLATLMNAVSLAKQCFIWISLLSPITSQDLIPINVKLDISPHSAIETLIPLPQIFLYLLMSLFPIRMCILHFLFSCTTFLTY